MFSGVFDSGAGALPANWLTIGKEQRLSRRTSVSRSLRDAAIRAGHRTDRIADSVMHRVMNKVVHMRPDGPGGGTCALRSAGVTHRIGSGPERPIRRTHGDDGRLFPRPVRTR